MKYRGTGEYEEIAQFTSFVRLDELDENYDLKQFDCGIEDYNNFLIHDARYYMENNISSVHLLIHNEYKDIIGYVALLTDSFLLDKDEKKRLKLNIPFNSVPALKIGKLAVSKKYQKDKYHYGSFLLELCLGKAEELNEAGIACRFLTVDADIEFNENTPKFYESNYFVRNEHKSFKNRTKSISMRYDLFNE